MNAWMLENSLTIILIFWLLSFILYRFLRKKPKYPEEKYSEEKYQKSVPYFEDEEDYSALGEADDFEDEEDYSYSSAAEEADDFKDEEDYSYSSAAEEADDFKDEEDYSAKGEANSLEEHSYSSAALERTDFAPKCAHKKETEYVRFAAFSPCSIIANCHFILDVWAFLPSDYVFVLKTVRELQRDAQIGQKTGVPISIGTILTIKIDIPSLIITEPIDTIIWEGEPSNASYVVAVPSDILPGEYPGKALISTDGIPIAKLVFYISVASTEDGEYIDRSLHSKLVQTAFASYASEDREEVLSRLHGMKKIVPNLEIFFDIFSLRSGDDWKHKLEELVPSMDTFYLFWSRSAAHSIWVEREWKLALSKRGLEYIDPVPLEDPDDAPPPKELSRLHFTDAYVGYIKYLRYKRELMSNH